MEEIQNAYRALVKRWHPDLNRDNRTACEEILKRINEAYRVLSDPILRAQYDTSLIRPERLPEIGVRDDVMNVAVDGLDDVFDGPSLNPEELFGGI